MRLALLINDREFRSALADSIAETGSDVLLDVICKGDKIESDALIITDAEPADMDGHLYEQIITRTVFLTSKFNDQTPDSQPYKLFKYSSVSRLLAEISDIYRSWRGAEVRTVLTSKVIACCTDSDAFSDSMCSRIARQIIYREGERVLVLPLGYINEHSTDLKRDINNFALMMYRVRKGMTQDIESLIYKDACGISRLMIPIGRNPVAYLDESDLYALINALSEIFDTLILDISACYRPENLSAIKNAGYVLCFETGRKRINFEDIAGPDGHDRIKIIRLDDNDDEDLAIDEYIDQIYGSRHEEL